MDGISDKKLLDLAESLGGININLNHLGLTLGFNQAQVNDYLANNRSDGGVTSKGTHQMLQSWKEKTTKKEQRQNLKAALYEANFVEIAEEYSVHDRPEDGTESSLIRNTLKNEVSALQQELQEKQSLLRKVNEEWKIKIMKSVKLEDEIANQVKQLENIKEISIQILNELNDHGTQLAKKMESSKCLDSEIQRQTLLHAEKKKSLIDIENEMFVLCNKRDSLKEETEDAFDEKDTITSSYQKLQLGVTDLQKQKRDLTECVTKLQQDKTTANDGYRNEIQRLNQIRTLCEGLTDMCISKERKLEPFKQELGPLKNRGDIERHLKLLIKEKAQSFSKAVNSASDSASSDLEAELLFYTPENSQEQCIIDCEDEDELDITHK